jgi:hypothetical protein
MLLLIDLSIFIVQNSVNSIHLIIADFLNITPTAISTANMYSSFPHLIYYPLYCYFTDSLLTIIPSILIQIFNS